jgi:hypothetical protein
MCMCDCVAACVCMMHPTACTLAPVCWGIHPTPCSSPARHTLPTLHLYPPHNPPPRPVHTPVPCHTSPDMPYVVCSLPPPVPNPLSGTEQQRITVGTSSTSPPCVWALEVLPDGTLVSGDQEGAVQFWDGRFGTLLNRHQQFAADVLTLAASPDGKMVWASGVDAKVGCGGVELVWGVAGMAVCQACCMRGLLVLVKDMCTCNPCFKSSSTYALVSSHRCITQPSAAWLCGLLSDPCGLNMGGRSSTVTNHSCFTPVSCAVL